MTKGKQYIICVDQGTSSTKCLLLDRQGRIVKRLSYPHSSFFPGPQHVEQDGVEIGENTEKGIAALYEYACGDVAVVSMAVQTGAFILWDADTGEAVGRMNGWQDRRGAEILQEFTQEEKERLMAAGYTPSAHTIPMRLLWRLRREPETAELAAKGRLRFGTVDCWLLHRWTRGKVHACNFCNASMTRMFDLEHGCWNRALLEALGVPLEAMPQVLPDDAVYGTYDRDGISVPIGGVMGDSAAAMFGQGCYRPGDVKITYGTGASYLLHIGSEPKKPPQDMALTTIWNRSGVKAYAWEGTVSYAGAALSWLEKNLKIPVFAQGAEGIASMLALAAGRERIYYIPAFTGLGSVPAHGCILGLSAGTQVGDLIRAALESTAFQVRDIAEKIRQYAGIGYPRQVAVDGGGSVNPYTMQFQADMLCCRVKCSGIEECSALGAAMMGGLSVGLYPSEEDLPQQKTNRGVYDPVMDSEERERAYRGWLEALEIAKMK